MFFFRARFNVRVCLIVPNLSCTEEVKALTWKTLYQPAASCAVVHARVLKRTAFKVTFKNDVIKIWLKRTAFKVTFKNGVIKIRLTKYEKNRHRSNTCQVLGNPQYGPLSRFCSASVNFWQPSTSRRWRHFWIAPNLKACLCCVEFARQ